MADKYKMLVIGDNKYFCQREISACYNKNINADWVVKIAAHMLTISTVDSITIITSNTLIINMVDTLT